MGASAVSRDISSQRVCATGDNKQRRANAYAECTVSVHEPSLIRKKRCHERRVGEGVEGSHAKRVSIKTRSMSSFEARAGAQNRRKE